MGLTEIRLAQYVCLMETVKQRKLKYFGHTISMSVPLEKDNIEGMMPGSEHVEDQRCIG